MNVVFQSVQQPVAHSGGNVQHANLQLTRSNLTTTSYLKKILASEFLFGAEGGENYITTLKYQIKLSRNNKDSIY